jgi:type III restriction enzyme
LKQWCADAKGQQSKVIYDFVYVDQESFARYAPKTFSDLVGNFTEYKEQAA